jgi:hypothetical protein
MDSLGRPMRGPTLDRDDDGCDVWIGAGHFRRALRDVVRLHTCMHLF